MKMSEIKPGEIEANRGISSQIIIELAGAAIFGALSIVAGVFLAPNIPRIAGWFIAIIDPISIIWIVCLLLFGVRAGILCSIVGAVGLIPFDPTGWIGPSMKFAATISLIIIPIIFLKLYKREAGVKNSQKLKKPRNYIIYGILGTVLRIIVMEILNIIAYLTAFAIYADWITLEFLGLPQITGMTAILIGAPLINAWQSLLDLVIPYLLVFTPKLDEKFEIW
jgi:riboflavin transporter FmnP